MELDGILRWPRGFRCKYSDGGVGINSLTWPLSPLRDYVMFPYKKHQEVPPLLPFDGTSLSGLGTGSPEEVSLNL